MNFKGRIPPPPTVPAGLLILWVPATLAQIQVTQPPGVGTLETDWVAADTDVGVFAWRFENPPASRAARVELPVGLWYDPVTTEVWVYEGENLGDALLQLLVLYPTDLDLERVLNVDERLWDRWREESSDAETGQWVLLDWIGFGLVPIDPSGMDSSGLPRTERAVCDIPTRLESEENLPPWARTLLEGFGVLRNDLCCESDDPCCYCSSCCSGECCGSRCCSNNCCGARCCNGPCCPRAGGCCAPGQTCCDEVCCGAGQRCCYDEPDYCCPLNQSCCGTSLCCPPNTFCCGGVNCCPYPSLCCGGTCCEYDGNPCTTEYCPGGIGCASYPNNDICESDGNPCTEDRCYFGACAHESFSFNSYPCTDDGNLCTDDYCMDGSCIHPANNAACDDGNPCTFGDICAFGSCAGESCDDDNPCTIDVCTPNVGCSFSSLNCDDLNECTNDSCVGGSCVHDPNSNPCDDDRPCTTGEFCSNGVCGGGTAPQCDDGNPCTFDGCDVGGTCNNTPQPGPCDDEDPCTELDHCENGSCVGRALDCSDNNPCTDDTCESAPGLRGVCAHPPNAGACDDGDPCTVGDHCAGGSCTGTIDAECPWPMCPSDYAVDGQGYAEDFAYTRTSRITIQQGTECVWVGAYYFSREYSHYTGIPSQFNDTLSFQLTYPGGTLASGSTNVNSLHNQFGPGPFPGGNYLTFGQAVDFAAWTISGDSWVQLTATATNIGDGALGSGVGMRVKCSPITAERLDQDDPTELYFKGLPQENAVVYGGSEPSTSDNLRLMATPSDDDNVVNVVWSSQSLGGQATWSPAPTGPTALIWDLGDILNPTPGTVEFKVDIFYENGQRECGKFPIEIGVRTDNVIVIGWIDMNNVPLNPALVSPVLTTDFPLAGPPVPTGFVCDGCQLSLDLTQGKTLSCGANFFITAPATPPGNDADRKYMLHWLFKYGGNSNPALLIPGGDFRNGDDTHIDFMESETFFTSSPTGYKLFQEFQVKFQADGQGFKTAPVIIRSWTAIGLTTNPLAACPGLPPAVPGQSGPNNTKLGQTSQSVWQVNEGSPDVSPILSFNTLMGNAVSYDPKFWESIGSRIRFRYDAGTDAEISLQVYPTYYIYYNGRYIETVSQLPDPQGAFTLYPYPFGAVPCTGIPVPHQQGRCGNATAPEDLTARIPPFLP